jgi:hypothetical protein
MMQIYVTYDAETGRLTGAFIQDALEEHLDNMIEVDPEVHSTWTNYRANATRDGVEPIEPPAPDIEALRASRNAAINSWRAAANLSTFPHAGKQIACDELSRSDIDGVANHIALFGQFPAGFPGGWKATDNTMIPLSNVDAFRSMYASMTAQGTENFNHSQELKAQLAAASTPDEIAAIQW